MASHEFGVPRLIVLGLIKTESNGNVAAYNKNNNLTYDSGLMQINSSWHSVLEKKYNIKNAGYHIKHNACYNIRVGAWILRSEIGNGFDFANADPNVFWRKVGNYNSHTERYNQKYRNRLIKNVRWIMNNTHWRE